MIGCLYSFLILHQDIKKIKKIIDLKSPGKRMFLINTLLI